MTIFETSVSKYSLAVDASESLSVMVEAAGNSWGRRLYDALTLAMGAGVTFVVNPYVNMSREDFAPSWAGFPETPAVGGPRVDRVLANLEDAGYVSSRTVLHETPSNAYLSDERVVTAVQVLRPFALVSVAYGWSPGADRRILRDGSALADRWDVIERSYIVPAGWYLVGETGEFVFDLACVAGVEGDADDFGWLFELEGFGVSSCMAGCESCGSRWLAESGSWHFRAEDCVSVDWDFDHADDVDEQTNTVACPQCGAGRVGFMIY